MTSGCWSSVITVLVGFLLATSLANNMGSRSDQETYLRQFAHLGESNPDPHMQELQDHPDRQFAMAVMSFQRFAGLNVTGVMDRATVDMMEMPRCGVRDMMVMGNSARRRKRYAAAGDRWGKLHLTYRFINYTPDLPRSTVRSTFRRAFQIWSDVSALSFSETRSVSDIEISFAAGHHGDSNAFDGPGNTLAHAYFPGQGIGGDAHFDEDETWTHNANTGTNLLQVAVHELGHSLGLGHSDVKSAIMAPFYRGYNASFRLDQDDIDGIRYLYGHGGSGGRPTTMGPRSTTTPKYGTTSSPDYCPLAGFCRDFDAIDVIDNAIHAFKGNFYAQLDSHGAIVFMARIQDKWPQLPSNLDAVMATRKYVYFFKGTEFWRMDARSTAEGVTLRKRFIRDGFPRAPDNMDAAFVWSGNGRYYFIKGNEYYRYRGGHGIDPNYPQSLSVWRGVRSPVSDAFQYDGVTYFFSGPYYQVFDDRRFTAGSPMPTKDLMDCCNKRQERLAEYYNAAPPTLKFTSLQLSVTSFVVLVFSHVLSFI